MKTDAKVEITSYLLSDIKNRRNGFEHISKRLSKQLIKDLRRDGRTSPLDETGKNWTMKNIAYDFVVQTLKSKNHEQR